MKILITLLLALFISRQAIADPLDSWHVLEEGYIIHKTERINKYGSYLDLYIMYGRRLFVCTVATSVTIDNSGTFLCKQQGTGPVRDEDGNEIRR